MKPTEYFGWSLVWRLGLIIGVTTLIVSFLPIEHQERGLVWILVMFLVGQLVIGLTCKD